MLANCSDFKWFGFSYFRSHSKYRPYANQLCYTIQKTDMSDFRSPPYSFLSAALRENSSPVLMYQIAHGRILYTLKSKIWNPDVFWFRMVDSRLVYEWHSKTWLTHQRWCFCSRLIFTIWNLEFLSAILNLPFENRIFKLVHFFGINFIWSGCEKLFLSFVRMTVHLWS